MCHLIGLQGLSPCWNCRGVCAIGHASAGVNFEFGWLAWCIDAEAVVAPGMGHFRLENWRSPAVVDVGGQRTGSYGLC